MDLALLQIPLDSNPPLRHLRSHGSLQFRRDLLDSRTELVQVAGSGRCDLTEALEESIRDKKQVEHYIQTTKRSKRTTSIKMPPKNFPLSSEEILFIYIYIYFLATPTVTTCNFPDLVSSTAAPEMGILPFVKDWWARSSANLTASRPAPANAPSSWKSCASKSLIQLSSVLLWARRPETIFTMMYYK